MLESYLISAVCILVRRQGFDSSREGLVENVTVQPSIEPSDPAPPRPNTHCRRSYGSRGRFDAGDDCAVWSASRSGLTARGQDAGSCPASTGRGSSGVGRVIHLEPPGSAPGTGQIDRFGPGTEDQDHTRDQINANRAPYADDVRP